MKIVELIRLEETSRGEGTVGVLKIDKVVFCFTLEPSDKLNKLNQSSIPAQQYLCKRTSSRKFGETFEVTNVPGRTHILFHSGNLMANTAGCILLGRSVGYIEGERAISNSKYMFDKFMRELEGEDVFHLTVKEEY